MRVRYAWAWLAVTLVLDACGPSGGSPATPVASAPPPTVAPVPSNVPGSNVSPDQQAAVAAAVQDATSRLGLSRDEVNIERVEAREWSDSSLGCPQPGNLYSQIVTPGFLIVINTRGKQLEYHSDSRGRVVLCRET
jgi:hypothetical protein